MSKRSSKKSKSSTIIALSVFSTLVTLLTVGRSLLNTSKEKDPQGSLTDLERAINEALSNPRYQKYKPLKALMMAMALHETGNLKSRFLRENKNLYGMGYPQVRPTTAIGKQGNHEGQCMAVYNSWADSARDLLMWFEYNSFPVATDPLSFVQNLKSDHYFSDSVENYYNGVKRFL